MAKLLNAVIINLSSKLAQNFTLLIDNVGSEVTFIKEDSKKMASYLFAIAAMDEDDFNRINYDYIATSLFDNYRQDI